MTFTINVVVTNPPEGTLPQCSLSVAFGRLTISPESADSADVSVSGSYAAMQDAWSALVAGNAPALYRGFNLGRYRVTAHNANGWNGLNAFATKGLFVGDPATASQLAVGTSGS